MPSVKTLFQRAWTSVVNPGQDERVAVIMAAIGKHLRAKRGAFDLDAVIQPIDCTTTDVKVATRAYYDRLLMQSWSGGIPDEKHRKTLAFVAKKLRLPAKHVAQRNESVAATYFGSCLGDVLADGVITDQEMHQLTRISAFVEKRPHEFLQHHLRGEGIGFLRGVFSAAITTGELDRQLWEHLIESARKLGLSQRELTAAVSPLARSFAEHVLADCKSDGVLTGKEEVYLSWLTETFEFDASFRTYVQRELSLLKERTEIASGNLTPVSVPSGINLKAGEIPYVFGPSTMRLARQRKSGPQYDDHAGHLILTDCRLLFHSATKPAAIPYRAIVGWEGTTRHITLSVASRPALYFFLPADQGLVAEKFDALIRLHGQVLRRKIAGAPDRHIPRDVRQRVWQRYGGRCAECAATDYLEFDHIVPVAKGGSNSDQNVQLLCRGCNLKKSDKI